MLVLFCFFGLLLAVSFGLPLPKSPTERDVQETRRSLETFDGLCDSATRSCSKLGDTCHTCLDGSNACFDRMAGQCCGCKKGYCWLCDYADECHVNNPDECYYNAPLTGGGIVGIAVSCLIVVTFCVLGIYCYRRNRHRYESNSVPVTVTYLNQDDDQIAPNQQAYPMLSFADPSPLSYPTPTYTSQAGIYNLRTGAQVG